MALFKQPSVALLRDFIEQLIFAPFSKAYNQKFLDFFEREDKTGESDKSD